MKQITDDELAAVSTTTVIDVDEPDDPRAVHGVVVA